MKTEKILIFKKEQLLTHQGDVVLERLAELPEKAKKCEIEPLAKGETSGHEHILKVKDRIDSQEIEFYKDEQGRMYFKVVEGIRARHEIGGQWTGEHDTIDIEPSKTMPYIGVRIQRVEDPYLETISQIKD